MSAQPIYAETEGYELATITNIDGTPVERDEWTRDAIERIALMEAKSPTWRITRAARPSERLRGI